MIEDGVAYREPEGNWGSLVLSRLSWSENLVRLAQEETQGQLTQCEVADDSVVVMKSRPEKAGNSLEEKTGMTCCTMSAGTGERQKPHQGAKG